MAKAKRRGDFDWFNMGLRQIGMKTARNIHRRLRKSQSVRRTFKNWFRCEANGMDRRCFQGKAAAILNG